MSQASGEQAKSTDLLKMLKRRGVSHTGTPRFAFWTDTFCIYFVLKTALNVDAGDSVQDIICFSNVTTVPK